MKTSSTGLWNVMRYMESMEGLLKRYKAMEVTLSHVTVHHNAVNIVNNTRTVSSTGSRPLIGRNVLLLSGITIRPMPSPRERRAWSSIPEPSPSRHARSTWINSSESLGFLDLWNPSATRQSLCHGPGKKPQIRHITSPLCLPPLLRRLCP